MRTSRRRSSNPKRARSSRLAKASEAKLELNEKNFIFRSDELQKKYLGSDSRYGSDVAVQGSVK